MVGEMKDYIAFVKTERYNKYRKIIADGWWGRVKNGLTIYDISKLSGVSIATVSRVLNGNPNVNEVTRERDNQVITKHGYVPKQSARNFRVQELYAVGLLMDDIRNPFMASFAFFISREFNRLKINTVLCNIHDVESEFVEQVDNLIDK